MENVVSIIKSRNNELEFDISIQGVEDEGTQVRFVIDADPAALIFNCAHKGDDKWVVNVPPIPQIEAKSYDFHIEIVVSGYFFTPFKGTINVTNEPEVKSSGVSAPVVAPTVGAIKVNGEATKSEEKEMKAEKKEEKVVVDAEEEEVEKVEDKKEEKKEEKKDSKKTEPLPDEYQDLADQLIKNHKEKKGKETEQGKKVKDVLKSMKKDEKKDEPKKAEKPKAAEPKKKEEKKPESKPAKKKEVKETAPIIPRRSNLTDAINDWKKPQELSEQAKKVQDILKTLH